MRRSLSDASKYHDKGGAIAMKVYDAHFLIEPLLLHFTLHVNPMVLAGSIPKSGGNKM
jgi:hypothetical protein